MKEIGIYIHIPFCKKKCNYCDFISFNCNDDKIIEDYIKQLVLELKENMENISQKYNVTTIYIGGGTPSYIKEMYIEEIITEIKKYVSVENTEITIEVNPGTSNLEKLKSYIKMGINRVSIGAQTTNNMLLKAIGRVHTYEQFETTYLDAKRAGFQNINVDLMIGLPNQTVNDVKKDLEKIIMLKPTHISVYSLILEENTKLEKQVLTGKLVLPDEEIERKQYWLVKQQLENNGFEHYEISNFALNGYKSKHNINCWNQKEYIGIGLAAHSYLNNLRYSNTEILEIYLKDSKFKKQIHEKQTKKEQMKEFMLLGLRKIQGVRISEFKNKFVQNPIFYFKSELNDLVNKDLIMIEDDYIKLTNKGIDLANIVWEKFV